MIIINSKNKIILIGFLLTFFSSFGQTFFISLFADKILGDFNIGYSLWGSIYFLGTITSAVSMIFFGGLIDKYSPQKIIFIFFILYSLACFMMALNKFIIILIFTIFLLRFCGQGMLSHIAIVITSKFFDKKRGKAIAIVTLGFSLAESLLPIIFVNLMKIYSWEQCWIIAGFVLLIFNLSLILIIKNKNLKTKKNKKNLIDKKGMKKHYWNRNDMLKNWVFWFSMPAFIVQPGFTTIFFFQQIQFVKEKNWIIEEYVSLLPIYTFSSLIGLFLGGHIIDKFGVKSLLPFFLLPLCLGLFISHNAIDLVHMSVAFSLLGVMQGLGAVIFGAFWPEFYGTRNLGSIRSLATSTMIFSTAIGPLLSGYLLEMNIYVENQYLLFALVTLLSSVGMIIISLFTKKYF